MSTMRNTRKNGPGIFVAVVIIIGVLIFVAFNGFPNGVYNIPKVTDSVKFGMDLKGGLYAVYQAGPLNKGKSVTNQDISQTRDIMRKRLDKQNYNDATVSFDSATKRIYVEIPSVKDPDKLMDILGKPAKLRFLGPNNDVIVQGNDIKTAVPGYSETDGNEVNLEFNAAGAKKFGDGTTKYVGKLLRIFMDSKKVNEATVQEPLTEGKASITHLDTPQEAKDLATEIQSGSIPVSLKVVSSQVVDSILGQDAWNTTLFGGLIALILVFLFMIVAYKVPGLVANVAMLFHTLIVIYVIAITGQTLTLPGIAGIILGIGMAVDANIIIFERMKEELRWGKSLRAAVDAGFDRAWTAILDGNVTTIIAAIVLYVMGSGSVRGFAFTLGLDVVANMFTAITVTRLMLRSLMNLNFAKNHKLFN